MINAKHKIIINDLIFVKIFDSVADALIVVNNEGQIVRTNKSTEDLFHYNTNELIDKNVEILIPPRFRKRHTAKFKEYIRNPHIRLLGTVTNLYARRHDETEFPADIMLSPLKIDNNLLVVATVRDITERKKIEKELIEMNNELEIQVQKRTLDLTVANDSLKEDIKLREQTEESLRKYTESVEKAKDAKDITANNFRHNIIDSLNKIVSLCESLEEDAKKCSIIENAVKDIIEIVEKEDMYA